jgi:hypothetical protein
MNAVIPYTHPKLVPQYELSDPSRGMDSTATPAEAPDSPQLGEFDGQCGSPGEYAECGLASAANTETKLVTY